MYPSCFFFQFFDLSLIPSTGSYIRRIFFASSGNINFTKSSHIRHFFQRVYFLSFMRSNCVTETYKDTVAVKTRKIKLTTKELAKSEKIVISRILQFIGLAFIHILFFTLTVNFKYLRSYIYELKWAEKIFLPHHHNPLFCPLPILF